MQSTNCQAKVGAGFHSKRQAKRSSKQSIIKTEIRYPGGALHSEALRIGFGEPLFDLARRCRPRCLPFIHVSDRNHVLRPRRARRFVMGDTNL